MLMVSAALSWPNNTEDNITNMMNRSFAVISRISAYKYKHGRALPLSVCHYLPWFLLRTPAVGSSRRSGNIVHYRIIVGISALSTLLGLCVCCAGLPTSPGRRAHLKDIVCVASYVVALLKHQILHSPDCAAPPPPLVRASIASMSVGIWWAWGCFHYLEVVDHEAVLHQPSCWASWWAPCCVCGNCRL